MTLFYHHFRGNAIERMSIEPSADSIRQDKNDEEVTYVIKIQEVSGMDITLFFSKEQLFEIMDEMMRSMTNLFGDEYFDRLK